MKTILTIAFTLFVLAPTAADDYVGLDRVKLKSSGGIIFGKVTERSDVRPATIEVLTETGATITFYRSQVSVRLFDDVHKEYLSIRDKTPNTIDGHMETAEWAKKNLKSTAVNGMSRNCPEQDYHLKQILKLDPDHKKARAGLGYRMQAGKWVNLEQMAVGHGLIRYNNKWVTQHELDIMKFEDASKEVFKEWKLRLKKILKGDRPRIEMKQVTDPTAIGPIIELYSLEKRYVDVRLLLADTMAQIETPAAAYTLSDWAVIDPEIRVRERCLVHLKKDFVDSSAIGRHLIERYLSTNNSEILNRAAFILGELQVEEAVVPLIKKLNTVNVIKNPNHKGSGNIAPSFGSGGNSNGIGMQKGSDEPSHFKIPVRNNGVLRALERITGTGFDYNETRWMHWYMDTKKLYDVDLRRDE